MKNIAMLMSALVISFIISCTMVPSRFQPITEISKDGGYVIEAEDEEGFYMEVFYRSYSFVPNPDDNIQEAKGFFVQVAQKLARDRSKAIEPIIKSQLNSNATRNIMDGKYAILVSGRVNYSR